MEAKIKFWDKYPSASAAEAAWDKTAEKLQTTQPLKTLRYSPLLPGITKSTRHHLKWKAMRYLAVHDEKKILRGYFFSKPLRHGVGLCRVLQKNILTSATRIFSTTNWLGWTNSNSASPSPIQYWS